MLIVVNDKLSSYPKVFEDDEKELYLIVPNHMGNLKILALKMGGHIYSSEYTKLEEILVEYPSFKEVQVEVTVTSNIQSR